MLNEKEITSLIKMLDDPDEAIAENIVDQLVKTGTPSIPKMQQIWEVNINPMVEQRIEEIEYKIRFHEATSFFSDWNSSGKNILEAWMFLSEMLDPDFNREKTLDFVNRLRFDTWKELNDDLTTLEKCKILTYIIQNMHQISIIDVPQDVSPSHYLLSKVAINQEGSRTSITILFQEIARMLDIELFGLNYFEYAILGYFTPYSDPQERNREDILFYIIFGEKIHLIGNHQLDLGMNIDDASLYTPTSPNQILHKILFGLKRAYHKGNQGSKEAFCDAVIQLLID
jgi:hypothetical protein